MNLDRVTLLTDSSLLDFFNHLISNLLKFLTVKCLFPLQSNDFKGFVAYDLTVTIFAFSSISKTFK